MATLRCISVLGALAIAVGLGSLACEGTNEPAADADVCARATHLFSSCGVVLPTLSDVPCTGAARLIARCVVDHAKDCDGLATLGQRLDACVEDQLDGGDLLPPPTDLPVPLADPDDVDAGEDGGDEEQDEDDEDGEDAGRVTELPGSHRSERDIHTNPKVMT
jgi:hypothetical protein